MGTLKWKWIRRYCLTFSVLEWLVGLVCIKLTPTSWKFPSFIVLWFTPLLDVDDLTVQISLTGVACTEQDKGIHGIYIVLVVT